MSIKKYNISIPKMDYQIISVSAVEGEIQSKLSDNDLMFMTVKRDPDKEDYEFQKSLGNGITYNEQTKKYEIEITSDDTKNMSTRKSYGYDITVYYDGDKPKQKIKGSFTIKDKYTLNEVS